MSRRQHTKAKLRTYFVLALGATVLPFVHTAQAWTLKTLYSFCAKTGCSDGRWPNGHLVRDNKGHLFGAASGGSNDYGTIFEFYRTKNGSWKYSTIHTFCSNGSPCEDGIEPNELILDSTGNLFGTTFSAGVNDGG